MDSTEEITEIHLIPTTEDEEKHWRNGNCWCEPKEALLEDYHEITKILDDLDDDYIIIVHNLTH